MTVDERGADVLRVVRENPEALVPWYLILSFLYYQADISLVPDSVYDTICEELAWSTHKFKHRHTRLINKDALFAGTGFHIPRNKYPAIVVGASTALAKEDGHWSPSTPAEDENFGY